MPARILVVDDIPTNVQLLEAKLSAEYYEVITADSGTAALNVITRYPPDVVLLDVMMPGMDGYEVCERIKNNPDTAHIPVVMVTALNDVADKVRGLEAGADDFLTKPVNDLALFARVRSLARLKQIIDELRLREAASPNHQSFAHRLFEEPPPPANILLLHEEDSSRQRIESYLCDAGHTISIVPEGAGLLQQVQHQTADLIILSLTLPEEDGLRLIAQLRTNEHAKHLPILLVATSTDLPRLAKGLDIGANDYIIRPIDRNELFARVRTQLRWRRYQETLRDTVKLGLSLADTDPLTTLYNRRYLFRHLPASLEKAKHDQKTLALMMIDIDHFKAINDTYGHSAGDEVLKAVARRLMDAVRVSDTVVRYGGEEFLILMPDIGNEDTAASVAERLRRGIGDTPVPLLPESEGELVSQPHIGVTVSVGLALATDGDAGMESLINAADAAMYQAKRSGRNRVICYQGPLMKTPTGTSSRQHLPEI